MRPALPEERLAGEPRDHIHTGGSDANRCNGAKPWNDRCQREVADGHEDQREGGHKRERCTELPLVLRPLAFELGLSESAGDWIARGRSLDGTLTLAAVHRILATAPEPLTRKSATAGRAQNHRRTADRAGGLFGRHDPRILAESREQ